ncbi:HAMP domain-containing histidine kinase [Aeromicrobium sp. YIM 150415]|uniref:sensor histidine kinase n=1 Tax=Aeromicrobium sp. YIM 150415 TaxID=2803912 RepID=UPI0019661D84|nr:HAMP domain-containing sensor histidine kinase [Aeromicrobium sp. YIM 150415]MBM9463492.1 HAMP domain-containing histidine kinase [Aeromicrobium sp. YIM 150415]
MASDDVTPTLVPAPQLSPWRPIFPYAAGVGGGLAVAGGGWLLAHRVGWIAAVTWSVVALAAVITGCLVAVRREERYRREALDRLMAFSQRHATTAWAVSHELRNPLTMIQASVSVLETEEAGALNDQQRQFVAIIAQQTAQAAAICEGILVQARIDSGTFTLEPQRTDLPRLVREIATGMRLVAEQRQQRILLDLPRIMSPAMVDHVALRQALSNLLLNACRYSSPGSDIYIKLLDNDHAIVLQVTDSGDGMSPQERDQLFEPFRSGAPSHDGTGLGLSITRSLIQAHGGSVVVDTRLRAGTSFMITLPKEDSDGHV